MLEELVPSAAKIVAGDATNILANAIDDRILTYFTNYSLQHICNFLTTYGNRRYKLMLHDIPKISNIIFL